MLKEVQLLKNGGYGSRYSSSSLRIALQSFSKTATHTEVLLCRLETLKSYNVNNRNVYYIDPSRLGIYHYSPSSLSSQLKPVVNWIKNNMSEFWCKIAGNTTSLILSNTTSLTLLNYYINLQVDALTTSTTIRVYAILDLRGETVILILIIANHLPVVKVSSLLSECSKT